METLRFAVRLALVGVPILLLAIGLIKGRGKVHWQTRVHFNYLGLIICVLLIFACNYIAKWAGYDKPLTYFIAIAWGFAAFSGLIVIMTKRAKVTQVE